MLAKTIPYINIIWLKGQPIKKNSNEVKLSKNIKNE